MDISGADVFFDVRFVTLLVILRGVVIGSPLLICPCLVPRRTISIVHFCTIEGALVRFGGALHFCSS